MLKGKKETTKWALANQKVDRVAKILRSKLIEAGHDVDEDMSIVDKVPLLLKIKADKDVYQAPNGKMRVTFGQTPRIQSIPIRDDAQNIEGLVQAISLYVRSELREKNEKERATLEFEMGRKRAREAAKRFEVAFEENQPTNRVVFDKNVYADFSGDEMCLFVRNVATEDLAEMVLKHLERGE